MAEIRINATGGVKLYDADDSHYAQIVAGTITSNVDAITLGHDTVTIADNLSLGSDSAVLKFGADGDTTLTHTDGTGLTLNSTNKLCFNDASQYIQGASNAILDIAATDEIELTATLVDLNGTLDVSGNSQFSGTITVGVDDTGKDVKFFGATASSYMLWDESADDLNLVASGLGVGAVKDLGAALHVKTADSGASAHANADEIVVEGSAHSGISILSGNSSYGRVMFGDDGTSDIGAVAYNHSNNSMNFTVNDATTQIIESPGYFTIGAIDMFSSNVSDANSICSSGSSGVALSLTAASYITMYCAETLRFKIAENGDLTATDTSISAISDERLKKDIADYTYDLNTFKQLRPRTFAWKNPNLHTSDTDIRGFVGQEVKAIDTYWTSEEALNTYSGNESGRDMSDADLIPANESGEHITVTSRLGKKDAMYVSVINQLITKIETLESKVAVLEG